MSDECSHYSHISRGNAGQSERSYLFSPAHFESVSLAASFATTNTANPNDKVFIKGCAYPGWHFSAAMRISR
jgi:hypothetical protein